MLVWILIRIKEKILLLVSVILEFRFLLVEWR